MSELLCPAQSSETTVKAQDASKALDLHPSDYAVACNLGLATYLTF